MCPECGRKMHWIEIACADAIGGVCVDCGVHLNRFADTYVPQVSIAA